MGTNDATVQGVVVRTVRIPVEDYNALRERTGPRGFNREICRLIAEAVELERSEVAA